MSRRLGRVVSGVGLVILAVVITLPAWLIVRQALTPRRLSMEFPLGLLPPAVSLEAVEALLQTQRLVEPFARSCAVAALATVLSLALALPASWALARSRWFGTAGISGALTARVIPPIVISLPLAAWLIRLGLRDHPTGIGLALAHVSATLPLAILICHAACRALPLSLEEVAEIEGAGHLATLRHVILPLTGGAVAAAGLLSFLYSWDDFTHASVIQISQRTLPPLIAYVARNGQLSQASALALVMLIPALVVMALLSRLLVRTGGLAPTEH